MPTEPNSLIEQAKCIDCLIPDGSGLPVLINIAIKITTVPKPVCVNLIPGGLMFGNLGFANLSGLKPGGNYNFIFGTNESSFVNGDTTVPSTGSGTSVTFIASADGAIVILTNLGQVAVTAIVCAI